MNLRERFHLALPIIRLGAVDKKLAMQIAPNGDRALPVKDHRWPRDKNAPVHNPDEHPVFIKEISRRHILSTGAAGLAAATTFNSLQIATASTYPDAPLMVVATIDGANYEHRENLGKDLGDFVSEIGGFTQGCVRSVVPGSPLTVFFRPDRTSNRVEVVFELGRLFAPATSANLGAYSVVISRGNRLLATVNVPAHYWFARWRWQSAPRPIVGNVATLMSQNLLPPYALSASVLSLPPAPKYTPYVIMGLAGVTPYMPQTGERPDIGLLTEPQAQYICTHDKLALDILRAQAEAAGTMPWHMRDENTNAPVNFEQYPAACWYQDQKTGKPFVAIPKSPITIDATHQPALSYFPYLLTGDPYHLEDLQFQATWNYGSQSLSYRPTLSQTRQFAWNMRTLGQCARITPMTVPSWLLGQSYWATLLKAHRLFFQSNYVNNASAIQSVFRATDNLAARPADGKFPAGTWCEPWQSEFLAAVLGWLVSMGHTEWRTSFDWVIGGTMARTSVGSGWVRAQSTPYEMMLRANATSPIVQTWAEAWRLNQDIGGLIYRDPNSWVPSDLTYLVYTRAALVYAEKLGVILTDNLSWANGQINSRRWKTPYKWRLGTGLT